MENQYTPLFNEAIRFDKDHAQRIQNLINLSFPYWNPLEREVCHVHECLNNVAEAFMKDGITRFGRITPLREGKNVLTQSRNERREK